MSTAMFSVYERIRRFLPLLVFLIAGIVCFALIDVSIFERVATYCDLRKVIQYSDDQGEVTLGRAVDSRYGRKKALPYSVAMTLVHYATSRETPQQTYAEIMITLNILDRRCPCNFLVYGLGHDSLLWESLNQGGLTVFLEEDPQWLNQMKAEHPSLQAFLVKYPTTMQEADKLLPYAKDKQNCSPRDDLLKSECKLALKTLPRHVYDIEWDVIMIDAPMGFFPQAPGRMSPIYTSAIMAKAKAKNKPTDILLHDVDRPVEKTWGNDFLCSKNLIASTDRLWHFQLHGEGNERSAFFCH